MKNCSKDDRKTALKVEGKWKEVVGCRMLWDGKVIIELVILTIKFYFDTLTFPEEIGWSANEQKQKTKFH